MATKSMRWAWGSFSDSTRVSLAKINSEYKELDVAVLKATNHIETPPKEKHVRTIFAYTSASRPRADVAYCINALAKRIGRATNWIVVLKALMVIHRTLREGDATFREELINYSRNRGHILNLANFKDDSGPAAWDNAAWTRVYALFLEERLECFRVLNYDVESERSSGHSQTRELDTPDLLEHLPALQALLHRLMGCQPEGTAVRNHVIQAALGLVLKESFKLYRAINDGIINLVDKFFEMQRHDAVKALEIYKRAGQQAERLSEFYDVCKSLDLARSFQFPTLEQPPQSFLTTMEEYVREVPKHVPPKEAVGESVEVRRPPSPPREEPPPPPPPEPVAPVQHSGDLLGLDYTQPGDVSQMEANNALALAIVPAGGAANGYAPPPPDFTTSGWELALVTAPSSISVAAPSANGTANPNAKLAGGFDKLTLDSLYEDALRRSPHVTPPGSTGPGTMLALPAPPGAFPQTPGFGGPQDPFQASSSVAPPPSVQMAAMAHQQQHLMMAGAYPAQPVYGMPAQQAYPPQMYPQMMVPQGAAGNPYGYGPPSYNAQAGMAQAAPPQQYQNNPFGNPNLI